ncbi:MAG TPA: hypothetical protein PLJ27_23255 [Polyangiaceae bacterium]|nr:MAG: hypothetical protein BWY17_01937 [Deltaproteobacteria bacterium ADurb.Bin207]HOT12831.1 hypothetical protein [Polyangiaceae bacterium]HPB99123.1 hypothetical protein [Polyangiaceae bacterium]HPY17339.1 hypothetical protein [Polyangiaceae bacterium]HQB45841.1 hypothetical protein [Polyangiaceae bacterium]
MALWIASCCSVFAILWALWELRLAATALNLQPDLLCRACRSWRHGLGILARAMQGEADAWETQLVRSLAQTREYEVARGEVNVVLSEIDISLSANTKTYAACARISVFGCLIAAAWLFIAGQGLTTAVLDVFAIGAAGVLSTLAAAKEAQRLVRRKRQALDDWVEELIRLVQWEPQGESGVDVE